MDAKLTKIQILLACSLTFTLKIHNVQDSIFFYLSAFCFPSVWWCQNIKFLLPFFFPLSKPYVCSRPALMVKHTHTHTHTHTLWLLCVCVLSPDLKSLSSTWQVLVGPEHACQSQAGSCICEHRWARWCMNRLKACFHSLFMFLLQRHTHIQSLCCAGCAHTDKYIYTCVILRLDQSDLKEHFIPDSFF